MELNWNIAQSSLIVERMCVCVCVSCASVKVEAMSAIVKNIPNALIDPVFFLHIYHIAWIWKLGIQRAADVLISIVYE